MEIFKPSICEKGDQYDLPKKINFGCGNNFLPDYLNVDINVDPNPNYWCARGSFDSPNCLPNNYFEKIEAQMVLEHIHPDLLPTIIYTMSCLLKKDGIVSVIVPNFEYFVKKVNADLLTKWDLDSLVLMREATFQLLDPLFREEKGRGHKSLWTKDFAMFLFGGEGFVLDVCENNSPILQMLFRKINDFSVAIKLGY